MALIGIQLDRKNPSFTIEDFIFWMPQFKKYIYYWEGNITLGSKEYLTYLYSNDFNTLYIGNYKVNLVTQDTIIYEGTITIGENVYGLNLNVNTKLLTAIDLSDVITQCTFQTNGLSTYNNLYEMANHKIFESIYGTDWKYAISLCIAHYLTLLSMQEVAPAGNTLRGIAGGQNSGVLRSASVGSFSKDFDLDKTMVTEDEALFWNQTKYGALLMALLKTKAIPSILVVTSHGIPGAN